MRKAITEGRVFLEPIEKHYRRIGWEQAVGSSGTIKSIEKVVIAQGWSDDGITPEALERLKDELIRAGSTDKLDLKGLSKDPILPIDNCPINLLWLAFMDAENEDIKRWL